MPLARSVCRTSADAARWRTARRTSEDMDRSSARAISSSSRLVAGSTNTTSLVSRSGIGLLCFGPIVERVRYRLRQQGIRNVADDHAAVAQAVRDGDHLAVGQADDLLGDRWQRIEVLGVARDRMDGVGHRFTPFD